MLSQSWVGITEYSGGSFDNVRVVGFFFCLHKSSDYKSGDLLNSCTVETVSQFSSDSWEIPLFIDQRHFSLSKS